MSDEQLECIDRQAAGDLDDLSNNLKIAAIIEIFYVQFYTERIKWLRNMSEASEILLRYPGVESIYITEGPNIAADPWRVVFGSRKVKLVVGADPPPRPSRRSSGFNSTPHPNINGKYLCGDFNAFRRTRYKLDSSNWCNFSDIGRKRRLLLALSHPPLREILPLVLCSMRFLRSYRYLKSRGFQAFRPAMVLGLVARYAEAVALIKTLANRGCRALVNPIHSYSMLYAYAARQSGLPVFMLQDGYLPSNYPSSTYWPLRHAVGIWWCASASIWGKSWGSVGFVIPPRRPQRPPVSAAANHATTETKRVIILCTHGGEWTSLVSRFNIDDFLVGVCEAARSLPEFAFRIRLHPTASNHLHDGVNSIERAHDLVGSLGASNISISKVSLGDDLSWGNYAVAEYSQTLIDFMALKTTGAIIYNPTKRRNFLSDFAQCGVPYAETSKALVETIRQFEQGKIPAPTFPADQFGTTDDGPTIDAIIEEILDLGKPHSLAPAINPSGK